MLECEALCPRIGIMANGRLRCLGSAQHLKDKFGHGFQVELKTKLVEKTDSDYIRIKSTMTQSMGVIVDEESNDVSDAVLVNNLHVLNLALTATNPDGYLVSLVNENNPSGYTVYKNVANGVATLGEVASFATAEMRMRHVETFIQSTYPRSILRECQDNKVRYEVSSEGLSIARLFATVEENKERLQLSDYGISQTSLEQVFNMHAAEAEKLKQGRDDR
jgi:ATP-binding cassette, subfamily A (ABC1), member 3